MVLAQVATGAKSNGTLTSPQGHDGNFQTSGYTTHRRLSAVGKLSWFKLRHVGCHDIPNAVGLSKAVQADQECKAVLRCATANVPSVLLRGLCRRDGMNDDGGCCWICRGRIASRSVCGD